MIGHQAEGVDGEPELPGLLAQHRPIYLPILPDKEHILTVIAPLRDKTRATRNDDASNVWHTLTLPRLWRMSNEKKGLLQFRWSYAVFRVA